ncbi:hypothetical protein KCH_62640 [Kitasatospora cheerisanensis KCTC 2395]|uniref:Uncharacterized protein n=1 Tax=Kitasatospora cheerisanensis KCTC 2395 TaxID=1348663 RepID=A0A066YL92_9ACTN|nr:hypothetical protein KCH_62640 [Kitasatospora cheerisanensis KCTC 2395]
MTPHSVRHRQGVPAADTREPRPAHAGQGRPDEPAHHRTPNRPHRPGPEW